MLQSSSWAATANCFLLCLGFALAKEAEKPNSSRIERSGILLTWRDSCIYPCWLCLLSSHSIACVTSHVKVPSWSRTSRDHTRSRRWRSQICGIEEECMTVTYSWRYPCFALPPASGPDRAPQPFLFLSGARPFFPPFFFSLLPLESNPAFPCVALTSAGLCCLCSPPHTDMAVPEVQQSKSMLRSMC